MLSLLKNISKNKLDYISCVHGKNGKKSQDIYGNKSLQSIIITIIIYHLKGEKKEDWGYI